MNAGQRKYLQEIIDARPAGVRQLFTDRGIYAEPTPELMVAAYDTFGKPFVGDLVNVVFQPSSSAEGTTLDTAAAEGEQKKTFWENLSGVLNGTANVLTGFGVAFGKTSTNTTQTPIVIQQTEQKNNTMLYLGIALLVVIVLVVIILVKKKS